MRGSSDHFVVCLLLSLTALCLVGELSVHHLSVTAPIVQLIGSVNDFEADLRKAGINARSVICISKTAHNTIRVTGLLLNELSDCFENSVPTSQVERLFPSFKRPKILMFKRPLAAELWCLLFLVTSCTLSLGVGNKLSEVPLSCTTGLLTLLWRSSQFSVTLNIRHSVNEIL